MCCIFTPCGISGVNVLCDLPPQVQLPGMKWVDGHKQLFSVNIKAVSSVHPQVSSQSSPPVFVKATDH